MPGFVYPNEVEFGWGLLIVVYPYITGLVAGAFIVSSLYHVFGLSKLAPVARFSLVTTLAFLLAAPLPLILDLGHPERALSMFFRPNLTSAMSGFGYIWLSYLVLVLVEVWLVFRDDIVRYRRTSTGLKKTVYSILALGAYEVSDASRALNKKVIRLASVIGIPLACLLHGYVGFIFGAIKANAWWSTPLMPIIFLLSAIVSGIALLLVLYAVTTAMRRAHLDLDCLRCLALWLGGFLTLALSMEALEILSMSYESEESWEIIRQLVTDKIAVTYFGVQFGMGSLLPLILLGFAEIARIGEQAKKGLRVLSGSLILIGVFAMRWNVVIGGQLVSKSLRGFVTFSPPLLGQDGILVAVGLMLVPLLFLALIIYFIPPWPEKARPVEPGRVSFEGLNLKMG